MCSRFRKIFLLLVVALPFVGTSSPPDATQPYDFAIVGAGPAGLQWALFLESAGVSNYVVLERNAEAGSFFEQYPRSRKLISANRAHLRPEQSAEFALRHDWHSLLAAPTFPEGNYSSTWNPKADEFVEYLRHLAVGLNIRYNTSVVATKHDDEKKLHTIWAEEGDPIQAKWLIVATGMRMRDVPPCLEQATIDLGLTLFTYENLPPVLTAREDFCRGKPVTVFGGGNAAFEVSDLLAACSSGVRLVYKHRPRFSYLTHYVGDVRISNAGILDRYQLKSLDELTALDNRAVAPQSAFLSALFRERGQDPWDPEQDSAEFDECDAYPKILVRAPDELVVYAGGFTGARSGLTDVPAGKRFPEGGTFWKDRKTPGKYFSGNLMHGTDYRVSAGGFVHGFRYLVRAQFRHLMRKHAGTPWPLQHFVTAEDGLRYAVARMQNASGLYQMQDFLTDVIVTHGNGSASYLEEVPEKWVFVEAPELRAGRGLLVKFAFSDREAWTHELNFHPSRVGRLPGLFLHPVVTPLLNGQRLEACHAMEDPSGEWAFGFMLRDLQFSLLLCQLRLHAAAEGRPTSGEELERAALVRLRAMVPDAEFEGEVPGAPTVS